MLSLDLSKISSFVSDEEIENMSPSVEMAHNLLETRTGAGNDFLGWVDLPVNYDKDEFERIKKTAKKIQSDSEVLVVVGIGGSYLGAKAAIEMLTDTFYNYSPDRKTPMIVFAGNSISSTYLADVISLIKDKDFSVNIISKSGTTTEPALAFRLLKTQLEEQCGEEFAKECIVCITDAKRGALRTLATQQGYKTFVIEDNIGGRFSVLTPVGLLPIACAGFDIYQLIEGANKMMEICSVDTPFEQNPAALYAATRNKLYADGKKIELLVNYHPKLHFMSEWWKQLYGESEGKDNKGIFPASVDFTTDLHSMGQYIQEGERHLMETVISVSEPQYTLLFPHDEQNLDGLNFLAGKRIDHVNKMAELGTMIAHIDGGVPNMKIELPKINEYYLGQLIYFFEIACGISGYLLQVNPFNQPGVEAYKKNMFALLDKPGYEAESAAIKARL